MTVGLAGIPSDKTCVISGCLLCVDACQLPLLATSKTRHALVCSDIRHYSPLIVMLYLQSVSFNCVFLICTPLLNTLVVSSVPLHFVPCFDGVAWAAERASGL